MAVATNQSILVPNSPITLNTISRRNNKLNKLSITSTRRSTTLNNLTSPSPYTKKNQKNNTTSFHFHVLDAESLATALEQCAAKLWIRLGTQIHARIIHLGLASHLYLSSKLLYLYSSCSQPNAARSLFDSTPTSHLNLFFYNIMVRAYTQTFHYSEAIHLFSHMLFSGFLPNEFTFPFILKSCGALRFLLYGRAIHGYMVVTGFQHDLFPASALLDLYSKCARLGDACQLFDRIPHKSLVTWNSMISAYAQGGFWVQALQVLNLMSMHGYQGHVSSWNSLIAGCVRCGEDGLALEILGRMLKSKPPVMPNSTTFNTMLPAIPVNPSLLRLKELHAFVTKWQVTIAATDSDDERLHSAIAAGYAYHGCLVYALRLFDAIRFKTSQLLNSLISGFINCGQPEGAFCVFRQMAMQSGSELGTPSTSNVSLTLLLPECGPLWSTGLEIHAHACRVGLESDTSLNNALVAMYARRGDIKSSEQVFLRTPGKDVISWNTMVSSYTHHHDFDRAFNLFRQMHYEDIKLDEFTFGSILSGCGHSGALRLGMEIHCYIIRSGFSQDYCVVENALVDMYGKCGCVEEARKLFDEMRWRDNVSWNTMISCYGLNAHPHEAISLFVEMQRQGWKPNCVTFIALLSACSHAGLVNEGLHIFQNMISEHGIVPDVEHYACIIDNLGRAGQLEEAYQLIKSMPMVPDDRVWGALLGGCRIHGNVFLAETCAQHLMELEPQHSGYHTLLSNIYANAHRWNDVAGVRAAMKEKGVRKCPGYSWVEVSGEFHTFFTADKSHEQCRTIYFTLEGLTKQLKEEGYVPIKDP